MSEAVVRTETDARGVTQITLSRPERKNTFDARLIAELTDAVTRIHADTRAVVLRSDGDTFCAGADLEWMRGMAGYSLDDNITDSRALAAMFAALDDLPMPLLARVQGAALGGGAGLVAVSDIAVAAADAVFGFTEVRLGIVPAVVSPYVVRKCGAAFAGAAFTSGIRFDARRARDAGLVQDIGDDHHDLDAKLDFFVAAVAAGGPQAVRAAKRLVRDIAGRTPADAREATVRLIAELRVGAEGQEGMRAFLEKRPPRWSA